MLDSTDKSALILRTIVEMVNARVSRAEFRNGVDALTQLVEVGLIDSTHLLDIILEVEQRCAVEFDPTRVDFAGALTIGALVDAFTTPEDAMSAAADAR